MENINITINKATRKVNLPKSVIGNDGENLQENLIFSFDDEFVNGIARLELLKPDKTKSYIMLEKIDETYQLPVKSVMTKNGKLSMQLVITEGTDDEEIPIFKSNDFYVIVNSSINAEIEQPEEYPEWIDVANIKLNEFDNLDITATRGENKATITITDKEGNESSVDVFDGQNGRDGTNGTNGRDGQNGQDGIGLDYNWDGTQLGIKREDEQNYSYVDLKGEQGDTGPAGHDGNVQDVKINGTSILVDGVANIPVAGDDLGLVKITTSRGITINSSNQLVSDGANASQVKAGTHGYNPITPVRQHEATFYGLAKVAGADMSSSNNSVGTYTDTAKVAIQKMLGIYESNWELIKEDTVTYSTENDLTIDRDKYGEEFELTDIRGIIWFPTQNNEAKLANGTITIMNGNTQLAQLAVDQKTVPANSSKVGAYIMVEQKNGMLFTQSTSWHNASVMGTVRMTMRMEDDSLTYPFLLMQETPITSIMIKKITGTFNYRIYGKRKWR